MKKIKTSIKLEPIESQSMQQKVYEQIRNVLMRGGFEPGQQLSGRMVANALGTSEMPARAALGRLLAEKALIQRANGTLVVPVATRQHFREVMELRALLERNATIQASGRIKRKGFDELRGYATGLSQTLEENDLEGYLDFNQKFKFGIYKHCSSETLKHHIGLLWLQCGPFLRHLSVDTKRGVAHSFCEDALRALLEGDSAAAGDAISKDIRSGMDFLLQHGKFSDCVEE